MIHSVLDGQLRIADQRAGTTTLICLDAYITGHGLKSVRSGEQIQSGSDVL